MFYNSRKCIIVLYFRYRRMRNHFWSLWWRGMYQHRRQLRVHLSAGIRYQHRWLQMCRWDFHPHTQTHMHAHVCSRDFTVASEPCIILLVWLMGWTCVWSTASSPGKCACAYIGLYLHLQTGQKCCFKNVNKPGWVSDVFFQVKCVISAPLVAPNGIEFFLRKKFSSGAANGAETFTFPN